MNKVFVLILLIFTIPLHARVSSLDLISLNGEVQMITSSILGNFHYHLRNNSIKSQQSYTFIIHPSAKILSVRQLNQELHIKRTEGCQYDTLTVTFSRPVAPLMQISLIIRFSLPEQQKDPRMRISPNYVFLDSRRCWFPCPKKNSNYTFHLTIETNANLHCITGGENITSTIIANKKKSTWRNQLHHFTPETSLLITDKTLTKKNNINVYCTNIQLSEHIIKYLSPYWNILRKQTNPFPLKEIHIFPMHIMIDNHAPNEINGEFLGSLIFLDQTLVDKTLTLSNYPSPKSMENITETLIHELHHSYCPGILKHNKKDLLFIESFVQYLSWKLILEHDPIWGQSMFNEMKQCLSGLSKNKKYYLWQYLTDIANLHKQLYTIDHNSLIKILIENHKLFSILSRKSLYKSIQIKALS